MRKAQKPNRLTHTLTHLQKKELNLWAWTLILSGFFRHCVCLFVRFFCYKKVSGSISSSSNIEWIKKRVRTPILNVEMFMVMVGSFRWSTIQYILCVLATPYKLLYIENACPYCENEWKQWTDEKAREKKTRRRSRRRRKESENAQENMECKCCSAQKPNVNIPFVI